MSEEKVAAFGIYADKATALDAVEALKIAGFRATDVSVLFQKNAGSKDLGHEKHSKAPEGAVAGAALGAILGALFGWVAALGYIAIAGLEPLVAAGPVFSALSGMGLGLVLGGVTGSLIGSGMPEYVAKRYVGRRRNSGILLSVHCDDKVWEANAVRVLQRTGGTHVSTMREYKADFARTAKPMPRAKAPHLN
ncbi:MAG TPA: quinol:electron acceptor oxidoreductase subunit ActD [Bryobacteraceae bacterium]|nr:quinol:electron acceptor oxidoreductase subunit ActD [Bryobacteraceae bacterium]